MDTMTRYGELVSTFPTEVSGETVRVFASRDEYASPPFDGDSGILFRVFESPNPFWDYAMDLFGERAPERVKACLRGEVLSIRYNRKIYFVTGLERYRHSGDVLAICGQGSFPDRQWDVSPIVGFVLVSKSEAFKKSERDCLKKVQEIMESAISEMNTFLEGDVWVLTAVRTDSSGNELATESIGSVYGPVGQEDVESVAIFIGATPYE